MSYRRDWDDIVPPMLFFGLLIIMALLFASSLIVVGIEEAAEERANKNTVPTMEVVVHLKTGEALRSDELQFHSTEDAQDAVDRIDEYGLEPEYYEYDVPPKRINYVKIQSIPRPLTGMETP